HLVNAALLAAIVLLVARLAHVLAGARAAVFAALLYALVYAHGVLLAWAACVQDLLATAPALVAALAFVRGKAGAAAVAFGIGLLAKESIAPLPLILAIGHAAAARGSAGARSHDAGRVTAPLWGALAAWAALVIGVRAALHAWAGPGTLALAD